MQISSWRPSWIWKLADFRTWAVKSIRGCSQKKLRRSDKNWRPESVHVVKLLNNNNNNNNKNIYIYMLLVSTTKWVETNKCGRGLHQLVVILVSVIFNKPLGSLAFINSGLVRVKSLWTNTIHQDILALLNLRQLGQGIFLKARLAALEVADRALLNQCYHPPIGVGRMI